MSKLSWNPWRGAAIGLVISLVALLVIGWASAHREQRVLEAERTRFCQRQVRALETRLASSDRTELRTAMAYHFTDQSALALCLGSDLALDDRPASLCWIKTGDGACYLDLAKELRAMYRRAGF